MTTLHRTNKHTRVDETLQKELAQYGVLRQEVMEEAPPREDEPNFFGIKYRGEEPDLAFGIDIKQIQKRGMEVGMAVPEDKSFDLLMTENFEKTVATANEDDLRSFIRRIVDKARI